MQIKIYNRQEVSAIEPQQWERLAATSLFTNPFYERWTLLPALANLQLDESVFVIAVYQHSQLVALFPVRLNHHRIGIQFLSVWKHSQCFLCDPLCTSDVDLKAVVGELLEQFGVNIFRIEAHSQLAFGRQLEIQSVVFGATRSAINNPAQAAQYLRSLPHKERQENQRIGKRFKAKTGAQYWTSDSKTDIDWLEAYCQLEHAGWKGKAQGSILSNEGVTAYYRAICQSEAAAEKIKYQALINEQGVLAISFRIVTNNQAFDLKTSFNEAYRELYPGVNLEMQNALDLQNYSYHSVDSCTDPENFLINRLWPDQRDIYSSLYFRDGWVSWLLKGLYRFKNWRSKDQIQ